MDISLKKEEYRYPEKNSETVIEESGETELSVPVYMPEIVRIVKSEANVNLRSCRLVGERVTVEGDCELRMIYAAEDGGIYSFSQSRQFTRYCESEELSLSFDVKAKSDVSYINCRALTPKKAEIKAGILITVTSYKCISEELSSGGAGDTVEERCIPVTASSLGCFQTKNFSMSDTVETGNTDALFIISHSSNAEVKEIKKIGNKIMLKGEAFTEIAYISSENKSETQHLNHTMPINQILEADGMDERFSGGVFINVTSSDVIIKKNSAGEGREFDIALGLNADIFMWENKDYFVMTDAYSLKNDLTLTKQKNSFFSATQEIQDEFFLNEKIDVSKIGVSSVADMTSQKSDSVISAVNNEFSASGSIKLSFILKNTAGEVVTFEKMLDYRYQKPLSGDYGNSRYIADVSLLNADCIQLSTTELQVKLKFKINAFVFSEVQYDLISSVCENGKKEAVKSGVTVYFPEKDEELWNIAKKYNTTVFAIASENEINGETTDGKDILFIPTA